MSEPLQIPNIYFRGVRVLMIGIGGTISCAIFPLLLPVSWMRQIHQWLGLGVASDQPIFEYMARSLCIMYFAHGVTMLAVARDLPRYWPLVRIIAIVNFALGGMLLGIDTAAGMPLWWAACEGPPIMAAACLLGWMHHRAGVPADMR